MASLYSVGGGKSAPVTVIILYKYYLYVGSDRPSLHDLDEHVVEKAAPKWRNLGEALLPYEQHAMLNVFAVDHPRDDRSCCMCVLKRWLDTDPDATWNELLRALKVGGLPHLANYLKPRITECEII